jgi:rod shape-determining protein MreD
VTAIRTADRRRRSPRGARVRIALVIALLLLLEFYLRPSLIDGRGMPDFLILGLLLIAIRQSPGQAAVTGLVVGLLTDVLTPAHFGAGMLAHVIVGWGAATGRAIFFADNLLVNALLFFVGTWVRNAIVVLLSGASLSQLAVELLVWSPLQGIATAVAGVLLVLLLRDWLAIRIEA